ncbi:hypothetical protein OHB26_18580 [Nocardia sp. NBC_01503]|uniref:hypothetical protein n=1 Tax=Nocardia sp. NBC_01503 TaxID=2975997 RepID=UPI002E7B9D59|nr:hypothetical protein [Nocardia sp. NBC_01503]WTL36021.1 hypothetical protein OHB26_18580 [Nocardia sp. NBC_01503]
MNDFMNTNSSVRTMSGDLATVAGGAAMSVSRGILATQGIRLSSIVGDLGLQGFATKTQAAEQIVMKQDKPEGSWHPAVTYVATDAFAAEAGVNPVHLLPAARRPRNIHLATVIMSRHRSRLR